MAKTVFEKENVDEMVAMEYVPRVKQMVRKLGAMPNGEIVFIEEVDVELSNYINNGWKLSYVQRLATEPDGHTILYVLTHD